MPNLTWASRDRCVLLLLFVKCGIQDYMRPLSLFVSALSLLFLAMLGVLLLSASAEARVVGKSGIAFHTYLELLKASARREGVSKSTIERMTEGIAPNPQVIALDQNQPGTASKGGYPPMTNYIASHVDVESIDGGRLVYAKHHDLLNSIEREYGAPGSIIVAIFGHETGYGRVKGNFDLARSLATLAWEGRRRKLFEGEFIALMKVADKGFPRAQLVGSYAGAFGNPQFLPSVYMRIAVDGDHDGQADIFKNDADTFASIANYFRDAGWRSGQPWGLRAKIRPGFNVSDYRSRLVSPVCPRVHERLSRWMTVAEWRAAGVVAQNELPKSTMVAFFQPDGPGTPAWLLTENFRAILEYNCSSYYALSVGLLADEIGNLAQTAHGK